MNRKPNNLIQRALIILFLHIIIANTMQAQINTNLPVGAIPGAIDVSPMGAATYTIPIEVVPGTQGMQPNLSIVYNSMGGMGLLGMKWDLAGLSAITRCGKNNYYDENITAVQFNNNDRFSLDGERLLIISGGSYGAVGGVYAAEMEDFMRVVSYGGYTGSPDYFKVYTDDGAILEYGNTNDSKHKLGSTAQTILSWYINKISDADGNYMTFYYNTTPNNEITVDSITYTGNTGITPYAKVTFSYTTIADPYGRNTFFIAGYEVLQSKLIADIKVLYNNSIVRKYQFSYFYNFHEGRTARLYDVVLYGDGGTEQLNKTIIDWGIETQGFEQRSFNINIESGERILTGDFDGDGFVDILVCKKNNGGFFKGWELYKYNPLSEDYYEDISAQDTSTFYYDFFASDVNGDGNDELVLHSWCQWTAGQCLKIISLPSNTLLCSTSINFGAYDEPLYFGDFDGNGTIDILFKKSNAFYVKQVYGNTIHDLGTAISFPNYFDIKIIDANGDGKKNILINKNGNSEIYSFNGSNFQSIFQGNLSLPFSLSQTYYECGDFNGDGITDLIAVCDVPGGQRVWKIFISTKIGEYIEFALPNGTLPNMYDHIIVADIDRDGKDDIIQAVYNTTLRTTTLHVLFSKGWVNNSYLYIKRIINLPSGFNIINDWDKVYLGDIDGKGKKSLIIKKDTSGSPIAISFNKDDESEFVKSITNGAGKIIKLNYKHNYFTADEDCCHEDCLGLRKKYFLSPVNELSVSSGIGNNFYSKQFQYANPIFSSLKRTLLGFKNFTCIDIQTNVKEEFFFRNLYRDISRQILLPFKYISYNGNIKTKERLFEIIIEDIFSNWKRYTIEYSSVEDYDLISNTTVVSENNYDSSGRLIETIIETYEGVTLNNRIHKETNNYTYNTINLNGGYQKKTVPSQIVATQQYSTTVPIIDETLTFLYYPASAKGRLMLLKKENSHGSISTNYEYLNPTGVCTLKTVSAAGCDSRTVKFNYDATHRFITKVTNPLNHEANFTYDAKTGNRLTETNANFLTTSYTYDNFGRLKQINYPDGTITKDTIYWYSGTTPPNTRYCTKTTTTGQPELIVYYDILGRAVCRQDDGYYFDARYNDKGQLIKTSYPYSGINTLDNSKDWNEYFYDSYGRKSKVIAPYCSLSYSYYNRKITTFDHLRSNISWKDYDALWRIIEVKDAGGTLKYSYSINFNKRLLTTIETNGATTTIETDLWGNRLKITDPNAGKITSTYNKFNELKSQTDALNNITTYKYDLLGRVTQKQYGNASGTINEPDRSDLESDTTRTSSTEITIDYTYDNYTSNNKGRGKIHQIKVNNVVEESFIYDHLSRMVQHTKTVESTPYSFNYGYTSNGQLETIGYPDNYAIKYLYSPTGKLTEIRNHTNNALIYKVISRNKFNEPTQCEYGNVLLTEYSYNNFGLLTRINTGNKVALSSTGLNERGGLSHVPDSTILNYRYAYDTKGLMSSRSESVINRLETFNYDNLDRLTKNTAGQIGQTGTAQNFMYTLNGNIYSNSQIGTYHYLTNKPHAVSNIVPVNNNVISAARCDVTYNLFNQPVTIKELDTTIALNNRIELFYDAFQQRNKMLTKVNDTTLLSTHFYITKKYEKEVDSAQNIRHYHYIYGDNGIVAMHIADISAGTDSIYYIHTDHLGSYCAITNSAKQVRQRNFFEPWGNAIGTANYSLTKRGFTGHEHYPQFKIINMNGRLYDPVIARFFSPDIYIQNPRFTQAYNRYSYALNNPLKYVDRTGQNYDDYDDYDDYWDDWDDGGGGGGKPGKGGCNDCPRNNHPPHDETIYKPKTSPGDRDRDSDNGYDGDYYDGWERGDYSDQIDPFDNEDMDGPGNPPYPPNPPGQKGKMPDYKSFNRYDNFNLPQIPIPDKVLKPLSLGTTILDGMTQSFKPIGKYVPILTIPTTALSTYNAFADLWNNPSVEHTYRVVNSAAGFLGFWGGAISVLADTYEMGYTWFINMTIKLEKQLQSKEFWSNMYGY